MKQALITGGTSGIGEELVNRFEGLGYYVGYTTRRVAEGDDRGKIVRYHLDMCNIQSVETFCSQIIQTGKQIDLLVLNAGYTEFVAGDETFEKLTPDIFNKVVTSNLTNNYRILYHLSSCLSERAHIVMVSSVAAYTGIGSNLAYTLSKNGIKMMAQILSKSACNGVRYNAVAPGLMKTNFTKNFPDEYFENYSSKTPMGRLATISDVADVVVSLECDMKFVNGQTIIVDGGFY